MNANSSWVLTLVALILGALPIILTLRFRRRLEVLVAAQYNLAPARVGVILPCKGIDPGLRENLLAFVRQDYPGLELVFVVATESDPAHLEISGLLREMQRSNESLGRARLVVAGIENKRAQKLTNQLKGIVSLEDAVDVLVFVDSDIRPDPGFVSRLVAPLSSVGVGASTGFRWYHPPTPTMGSILRSTWNAGALPFLTDSKRNFAFGGAMAIRRDVFEQAGIPKAWDRALSDDFPFTLGVRQLGLEVRFVPSCIAVSYESSSIAATIEFTNRQSIISRVYFPPLWWGAAIVHSLANLLLVYGLVSLIAWLVGGGLAYLVSATCLLLLPMQFANAFLLFDSAKVLLPQLSSQLDRLKWRYVLCAPLASLLSLVNTVVSLTTRRITWRGVRYELKSPTETIVLG